MDTCDKGRGERQRNANPKHTLTGPFACPRPLCPRFAPSIPLPLHLVPLPMFGALKSSWSEWAPVLQQLPAAAVEGVKSAAGRNKSSHSSGGGSGGGGDGVGSSVSAARLAATRTAAHDATSASAASAAASSASAAPLPPALSDSTAASGGGARLFGFTSKLASNLKEGWRAKVGGGGGGGAAGGSAAEERGFLIDPSRSTGGGLGGGGSSSLSSLGSSSVAVETKLSKNGVDAFSFDDHDPPEEDDDELERRLARTPLGLGADTSESSATRPSPLAQHKQNRAAASAAAASAAAYSSAAQAASASSKSAAAAAAASHADSDSTVAPASHFASLPKLSAVSSSSSSSFSSAAAAPPFSFDPSPSGRSGSGGPRSDRDAVRAGAYVESQMFASRDLERQQDELLDDMSHSISRLQQMGTEINTQLTVGNALLTELDDEMSQAQDTYSVLDRKMKKLLKRSSLPHLKIIFCLLLLIAFLLFLLFYW